MPGFSDVLQWARQKLHLRSGDPDARSQSWPNPKASTGDVVEYIFDHKREKIMFTCWEAVGPARERWMVLGPQVRTYVTDHDASMNGDGFALDLQIVFYMIGRTRNTAIPTVVFRSRDPMSRNGARDVVERSQIMKSHPGIHTCAMSGRPIERPASEDSELRIDHANHDAPTSAESLYQGPERQVSSFAAEEAFGRRLWIQGHDGISRRLATGALLLRIGDRIVQLTVGHAFQNTNKPRVPPATFHEALTLEDVDLDGMSDALGADDAQFLEELEEQPSTLDTLRRWLQGLGDVTLSLNGHTQMTPKSKQLSSTSDIQVTRRTDRTKRNKAQIYHDGNTSLDPSHTLVQVGRLFDLPESGDLDYALVELGEEFRSGLNRIKFGKDVLDGWLSVTAVRDIVKENKNSGSISISTWTSSKGHASGTLFATPIYLRMAGERQLQEVFRVELDIPLAQGDCGSPIVDRIYGHFCGHIVAGVVGTGEAYMVAASRVMEDIEARHRQKPQLAPPVPVTGIARELELQRQRQGIKGIMRHLSPEAMPRYERDASMQTVEFASRQYFMQNKLSERPSSKFFVDLEIMSRYMNIGGTTTGKTQSGSGKARVSNQPSLPSSSRSIPYRAQVREAGEEIEMAEKRPTSAISSHLRPQSTSHHIQGPTHAPHEKPSQPLPLRRHKTKRNNFEYLFFERLPLEIELEIMSWLGLPDILHLRLVSRVWNDFITSQDSEIVSSYLRKPHIPSLLINLFPPPPSSSLNLGYIAGLWHRYSTACYLASSISEWITRDQFLLRAEDKRQEFLDREIRMRRRLVSFLIIAGHYLETYCHDLLTIDFTNEAMDQDSHETIERHIMAQYNDMILLHAHQFFPILLDFQSRRLRPASYLGHVERSLRGYMAQPLSEDVQVAMLYLGGLHTVKRLTRMDTGYEKLRRDADTWFADLIQAPAKNEKQPGLRRIVAPRPRGHSPGLNQDEPGQSTDTNNQREPKGKALEAPSLIKPTSLSDTKWRPMGSDDNNRHLNQDQVNLLLGKLSKVNKSRVWVPTAEAMLLERGVIARAQDIKRHGAVFQELVSPEPSCMDVFFYERGLKGELDLGATFLD